MKMTEIDELRSQATAVALASHPEGPPPAFYAGMRNELEVLEKVIEKALKLYWAQPDCPFCRSKFGVPCAKLETTTTTGRLACERCGAISLVGHRS